jgi:hypothetical protein
LKTAIESLPLSVIRRDGGTQKRDKIDPFVVSDYAEAYCEGADMPPLVVFYDGTDHWLADGFHRFEGAEKAGFTEVPCDVRHGTLRDAIWYACGANTAHGLQRSNADKRIAVETLLKDEEWGQKSDNEIARHAGVVQSTVTRTRHDLEATNALHKSQVRKGADGRTYNTSRIGKRKSVAPQSEGDNGTAAESLPGQTSMFAPDLPQRQESPENTIPGPEPQKSGPSPPEKPSPLRRTEAERLHELLEDYVKTFDSITCKIEGSPEYRGCGGIARVVVGIPARELQLLKGRIELVIERLQGWVEVIGERL